MTKLDKRFSNLYITLKWNAATHKVLFYVMISRASLVCPSILNTVAAICDGVRPASASWSAGDPWSMYRSGRTSGLHCKCYMKWRD